MDTGTHRRKRDASIGTDVYRHRELTLSAPWFADELENSSVPGPANGPVPGELPIRTTVCVGKLYSFAKKKILSGNALLFI